MRFIIVIAAILLFAEYSNLIQLTNLTEVETFVFCDDSESEEENKSEKEFKKFKFDKHHYNFDYANLLIFIAVGILTLLIACINYINLSTAQSFTRIKDHNRTPADPHIRYTRLHEY